ncbi:hypothetical protein SLA2020_064720 [Shorea laevis]
MPAEARIAITVLKQQIIQPVPALLRRPFSTVIPNPNPNEENPPPRSSNNSPSSSSFFSDHNTLRSYLYSQLKSPTHLSEAKRLHGLLIIHGFLDSSNTDKALGSQLVIVYVRCGCFYEARQLFDNMPQKSTIAWNAILRGFLDAGQFSKAIEFYKLMLNQGGVPDNYTYPLVLKACAGLGDVEEGKRIRDSILLNECRQDLKHNVYVECAMIDMFAKCGCLSEARKVFEEIPKKDLACWSAMISGGVQGGEWSEALTLFRRMKFEELRPDAVIVAVVLPACARLEAKQIGMALHGCSVRSGFERDLYVSNALMDMYCKCSDTHSAYCIFRRMENKDVVSWNTLIAGYSQNCQYHESVQLYHSMISADVRPDATVAASVLTGLAKLRMLKQGKEMHNYILKQGFESDIVLGSALIDMYASCGSVREAEHIFGIMLYMDIMIWNSMIVGFSLNNEVDSAFWIFQKIWDFNLTPNSITLLSILPICTRNGTLRHGKEIHGFTIRSSLGMAVSIGNSLIDMYCKCGCLELGINVFNQMTEKNIVTYNTIISAHGIYGLGECVFSFFEQMKEERIRPNKVTFIALLTACSHAGLVDRGWSLYNSMIYDYHIQPDMEHYSCIVDLLGRAGQVDDAYDIVRRMPLEPDINVWGSLLAACRVHNKVELAELVEKQILKQNQKDTGHYVLLSNVYASTGRWSDALKIRKMIKEKGLARKPGSSWIQLG